MTSIFENTHSKVTVHILHDDTLTDDNRRKFIRTAEKYSQGLELHDVTAHMAKASEEAVNLVVNKWSVGTLYRLFIPEILALERVIKGNLTAMSMEWFSKYSHLATLPDQDALNAVFRGHIKIIGRKYNNFHIDSDISGTIVHTWPHKPWLGLAGFRSDALYWKFFLRSAWGENITGDELIDIFNSAAFRNRQRKSAVRRAVSFIKGKILFWQPVRIMRFLFSEAKHRLTRR